MTIRRVVPNIPSDRINESRKFYTEFLGFQVAMDMEWIITLMSPDNPTAQVSIVQQQPETSQEKQQLSLTIEVNDVDAIYNRAMQMDIRVIYPLKTESWGVRRFHVMDPNGVIINVMSHLK